MRTFFKGFLYVLALEIKAYGIRQRLSEIYEAFNIAREKKISYLVVGEKLELALSEVIVLNVRRILGNTKRKLMKCKTVRNIRGIIERRTKS